MKYYDMITIPDLGSKAVFESIKNAEDIVLKDEYKRRQMGIDFYYNRDIKRYVQDYFPGTSLSQIPVLELGKIVSRFARARMMLYKAPAKRFVGGELAEEYLSYTHHLNSSSRIASELAWLLGTIHIKSVWNERKQKIEYHILPNVREYYYDGEMEPYGYSYERGKNARGDREFVFWSEARDGEPGMHFLYDINGRVYPIQGNPEMINPYQSNPISRIMFPYDAMDVTVASLHSSIAFTEVMLATRYQMGSPVITGIDQEVPNLKWGVDRLISLPEGSSMSFVSPPSNINQMISGVKELLNVTGQNHALSIRWGEQGQIPSGQALKILNMENLESRESDIPMFQDFEEERYMIDRNIIEVHTGKALDESFAVDFSESDYPEEWNVQKDRLQFMLDNGLMDKKELYREFNKDITDEELEQRLEELEPEVEEPQAPTSPLVSALQRG
tara:strand:+ start:20655 stop:21989 length:1335 start_codon:yes stop_codon:yes gene_type:complete